jgi:hypothetical protein
LRLCPWAWDCDFTYLDDNEQRQEACLSKQDERRFCSNSSAWDFFKVQPPGYRKIATFWVVFSAKRDQTRERRLVGRFRFLQREEN